MVHTHTDPRQDTPYILYICIIRIYERIHVIPFTSGSNSHFVGKRKKKAKYEEKNSECSTHILRTRNTL